jgi:hypothetical protein
MEDEMPNPLALSFFFQISQARARLYSKEETDRILESGHKTTSSSANQANTCLIHQSSTTILYPEWVSTFHGRSLERKEFGSDIHQIPVETKKKYFGTIGTQSKWHNDCEHYW